MISLSTAGLLVTGYALGVAVGSPILTSLSARFSRKTILLALMANFTMGNLISAMSSDFGMLMLGRVLTSLTHGAFLGIGSVVAAGLVPTHKRASAIAIVFTGLTLANLLGVPFGTWLGQTYGWSHTFSAIAMIGPAAMIALAVFLPADAERTEIRFADELRVLIRPQVMLALLITVLGWGGLITVLTYISPLLTQVAGLQDQAISPILMLFGAGLILGNLIGGKLADNYLMATLIGSLLALGLAFCGLALAQHSQVLMVLLVGVMGVAGFAAVTPYQVRVLEKAAGAPTLAAVFNISAFNLGSALGSWVGGLVIDHGPGLPAVPWAALAIVLAAIAVSALSWRLDPWAGQPPGIA